jgi:hypothetical protein
MQRSVKTSYILEQGVHTNSPFRNVSSLKLLMRYGG